MVVGSAETVVTSRRLGVFARLPVPGKVKSRLAATVGQEKATSAYKAFAEHCFTEASRCPCADVTVFHSVPEEAEGFREWLNALKLDFLLLPQVSNSDLGERMSNALYAMLSSGGDKAIIVGTDIPDLSAEILTAAFEALEDHEVVLGPACDGGYYLIGMTRLPDGVLQGIEWSTGTVYKDTEAKARAAGLQVAPRGTLPVLQDIDHIEDLADWYRGTSQTDHVTPPDHPLRKAMKPLLEEFEAAGETPK